MTYYLDNFYSGNINKTYPVLAIGAAGMDIVGKLDGELLPGVSNPAIIRMSLGGAARNVSENLVRLGCPVKLLSVLGDDESGNTLLSQAARVGIDIKDVVRLKNHSTSSYLAIIDTNGNLGYAIDDMRSVRELTKEYILAHEEAFQNSSMIFVDANLSKEALRTVFSLARKAKVPVCADPASATLAAKLKPHLDKLFMVVPNVTEAGILCNSTLKANDQQKALEAAKCLVSQGVVLAIIALGEYGVCYATSDTSGRIPAIRTEIVDPTGAGDALTATVIYSLLNDIPLDDAVKLGISAASLTLNYRGTVVPDLTLEKLYDHMVM